MLDPRGLSELKLAKTYVQEFNHGTSGHLAYVVIADLGNTAKELLDVLEAVQNNRPNARELVKEALDKYEQLRGS